MNIRGILRQCILSGFVFCHRMNVRIVPESRRLDASALSVSIHITEQGAQQICNNSLISCLLFLFVLDESDFFDQNRHLPVIILMIFQYTLILQQFQRHQKLNTAVCYQFSASCQVYALSSC